MEHLQEHTVWTVRKSFPPAPQFGRKVWKYTIESDVEAGRTTDILGDSKNWALRGDTKAMDVLKEASATLSVGASTVRPPLPKKAFMQDVTLYGFEWWFNFLWNEVPMADKYRFLDWVTSRYEPKGTHYELRGDKDIPVTDKREVLDQMLALGFIPKKESEMVPIGEAYEGPQGPVTKYHKHVLPGLKGSGLVYRSDSRTPETIRWRGGSKPRSRLSPAMLAEVGMTQAWHPLQDEAKRRFCGYAGRRGTTTSSPS